MNFRLPFTLAAALMIAACGDTPQSRQNEALRPGTSDLSSEISNQEIERPDPERSETVNINTAPVEELQRIPHVGGSMAEKIVEHREKYGRFKRPEHLMLLQGMSDSRFRRIHHLIRVE